MNERPAMLTRTYGQYYNRGIPSEDAELTHSAPGTPCGEYLRRFWQPIALSADVTDLPHKIKVMHEDLVVFRDKAGSIGVLELHCPHRGASLEYGQIRDRGLSCCYHGWHFDVDGRILEMPTEPPESKYRDKLFIGAYPAKEYKGFIWAYMGPPETLPPFPRYDILETDEFNHKNAASRSVWPCNWLQIRDNFMDPLHVIILHTISPHGTGFAEEAAVLGEIDFVQTPVGMVYVNSRRIGENVWIRMAETVYPNMGSFGLNAEDGKEPHGFNGPEATVWSVPMDDTHTLNFRIRHFRSWEAMNKQPPKMSFGQEARSYADSQRLPGDYEAQTSQRPIAIHALEHLAHSDRGIVAQRKLLRDAIAAVKRGEDPHPQLRTNDIIPTYCNDTVVKVPPAANEADDKKLRRETGMKVIKGYLQKHPEKISCKVDLSASASPVH
jgi:nitrite reductase/ring-hydroxylating ferredoxin subunit